MSEKKFGYGRVSTQAQNEARQVQALLKQGIDREDIITDKASGKNADRPGLKSLLEKLRAGDTVVVLSIDRLGRNTRDVLNIVEKLQGRGVKLVSLQAWSSYPYSSGLRQAISRILTICSSVYTGGCPGRA